MYLCGMKGVFTMAAPQEQQAGRAVRGAARLAVGGVGTAGVGRASSRCRRAHRHVCGQPHLRGHRSRPRPRVRTQPGANSTPFTSHHYIFLYVRRGSAYGHVL